MIFPENQIYCVLDYETYSEADLKKVGAFEYSAHPSTEILCLAFAVGTKEQLKSKDVKIYYWAQGITNPANINLLSDCLHDPNVVMTAHNAYFEQVITANVLTRFRSITIPPPERWYCTAAMAAAMALPRNLEKAALAMGLKHQKDMAGHRLMMKLCKPRKATKYDPSTRHTNVEELERLLEYCIKDIRAEIELFTKLPPLHPNEHQIWCLDQKINLRGFEVDRELVLKILALIEVHKEKADRLVKELTLGVIDSASQRGALLSWLQDVENVEGIEDLRKGTVSALLEGDLKATTKSLLQCRKILAKTSTAKYQAFEMRSRFDGRVRDNLVYHAASTGRWGGSGVQPQNLKRATLKFKELSAVIDLVKRKDTLENILADITIYYGEPMEVFSDLLRSVIVAPAGKTFDVADYNAIETRVLFWVAKHEEGLKLFREGRDLYREQASRVFYLPVDEITKDSFERYVGKALILACGFGMGPAKFAMTCEAQGQPIEEGLARAAVEIYRRTHYPIPQLWTKYEAAATEALLNKGNRYEVNYTTWYASGHFLYCQLPSGRRLAYCRPQLVWKKTPWGEKKLCLQYFGVNSITKKWELQDSWGGVLVENVVQAISRDIMAEAMLRIEGMGMWDIVLSVHDELIAERPQSTVGQDNEWAQEFCRLMKALPPWAEGLPLEVEGWAGNRYKK